jgi:competence protein ComEA
MMKSLLKAALFSLALGLAPMALAQQAESININTADTQTLAQLPGIGDVRAQAIVDDRQANGPYASVEELTRVSGIGEATVKTLRDQVAF